MVRETVEIGLVKGGGISETGETGLVKMEGVSLLSSVAQLLQSSSILVQGALRGHFPSFDWRRCRDVFFFVLCSRLLQFTGLGNERVFLAHYFSPLFDSACSWWSAADHRNFVT